MDLTVLEATLVAIVVAATIIGGLMGIDKRIPSLAGMKGLSKWSMWVALRPVLVDTYKEIEGILEDKEITYEEVEDLVFRKIMPIIQASRLLTKQQKALMTEDVIRGLVRPMLRRLYEETKQRKIEDAIKRQS